MRKGLSGRCGMGVLASLALVMVTGTWALADDGGPRMSRPTIRSIIVPGKFPETRTVELLKKYKSIGINYITVYNPTFWMWVEKEPGKYDFSVLDDTLNNVRAAGLKAIVRSGAEFPPSWVFTYGKEQGLTDEELDICYHGRKKIDLKKLTVYPAIVADGTVAYCSGVDPWDATGNYLKCRYIAKLCHHLQENHADVVEYVDAGALCEGIWSMDNRLMLDGSSLTPTWSPPALDSYRRYLQEIYMHVADANKLYKTNWKSFWEAVPPRTYGDSKYFWDWHNWYERGLVALFMREAANVRRAGFKVSVLIHSVGTASHTTPAKPNPAAIWVPFRNMARKIGLIDADLYILGGGFANITWRDELPYDPYGKNPLVLVPYDGVEVMRKRRESLYIIEDWEPNPTLAEYIGLDAAMVDGFQIMQGTIGTFSFHPKGKTVEGKTTDEMFDRLRDAIQTFFIWNGEKPKEEK